MLSVQAFEGHGGAFREDELAAWGDELGEEGCGDDYVGEEDGAGVADDKLSNHYVVNLGDSG